MMSSVTHVKINVAGATFGRSVKHGDYEIGSVHSVKDLGIDSKSLGEWLERGILLEVEGVVEKVKADIVEVLTKSKSPSVESEGGEVEYAETRYHKKEGKDLNLDEYWEACKKVGSKKRRCPINVEHVQSSKIALFECCADVEVEKTEEE